MKQRAKPCELLPANVDAEKSVLGGIVLDNLAFANTEGLAATDFSSSVFASIYKAMAALHEDGRPIDPVTLLDAIGDDSWKALRLDTVVPELTENLPRSVNVPFYAAIVRDKAYLRRLMQTAESIRNQAGDGLGDQIGLLLDRSTESFRLLGDDYRARLSGTVVGIRLTEVQSERVSWLWRGRIPFRKLTIVDGDPGLGKSVLTTEIAARISTGRSLLDSGQCAPMGVVLLSAEDGLSDTIRPRLEAAGADLSRIVAISTLPGSSGERMPEIPRDIPHIEAAVGQVKAGLVVIDPLMAFLGSEVNSRVDQDVRRALAPLAKMAERTGAALLLVRHLNKMTGTNAVYRGGGSIGIIGAARSGLLIARDPNDPDKRVLASIKSNLAAPPASLSFCLRSSNNDAVQIEWLGESQHGAEALLAAGISDDDKSEVNDATAFLRELLTTGSCGAAEIERQAQQAGIPDRMLRRAKTLLGVKSVRRGGTATGGWWEWELPEGA